MRRIIVAAAAAAVISGLVAGPAVAKPKWWGAPPAGSVVEVAVKASGGGTPDSQPVRLRPARPSRARHRGRGRRSTTEGERSTARPRRTTRRSLRLVADLTGSAREPGRGAGDRRRGARRGRDPQRPALRRGRGPQGPEPDRRCSLSRPPTTAKAASRRSRGIACATRPTRSKTCGWSCGQST